MASIKYGREYPTEEEVAMARDILKPPGILSKVYISFAEISNVTDVFNLLIFVLCFLMRPIFLPFYELKIHMI